MHIDQLRGAIVESRHRVAVAVVDAAGRLVARAGDPALVTYMRSAAKPFQAIPLVADGAAERFGITSEQLALACASHNSEVRQVALVRALLERIGCDERDLACGPHAALARELVFGNPAPRAIETAPPSPLASNCSGKHAAMLALARHHDWETAGYHASGHPVQRRVKQSVAHYLGLDADRIGEGVDGCGVVSFAVPLAAIARGAARLTDRDEPAARAVAGAMIAHPDLVGGTGRFCTELMEAYGGRVLAKVGAAGVYLAALMDRGLGIALKVEDGDGRAAVVALMAVLATLDLAPSPAERLPSYAALPLLNTRHERVGELRATGAPAFV